MEEILEHMHIYASILVSRYGGFRRYTQADAVTYWKLIMYVFMYVSACMYHEHKTLTGCPRERLIEGLEKMEHAVNQVVKK